MLYRPSRPAPGPQTAGRACRTCRRSTGGLCRGPACERRAAGPACGGQRRAPSLVPSPSPRPCFLRGCPHWSGPGRGSPGPPLGLGFALPRGWRPFSVSRTRCRPLPCRVLGPNPFRRGSACRSASAPSSSLPPGLVCLARGCRAARQSGWLHLKRGGANWPRCAYWLRRWRGGGRSGGGRGGLPIWAGRSCFRFAAMGSSGPGSIPHVSGPPIGGRW